MWRTVQPLHILILLGDLALLVVTSVIAMLCYKVFTTFVYHVLCCIRHLLTNCFALQEDWYVATLYFSSLGDSHIYVRALNLRGYHHNLLNYDIFNRCNRHMILATLESFTNLIYFNPDYRYKALVIRVENRRAS